MKKLKLFNNCPNGHITNISYSWIPRLGNWDKDQLIEHCVRCDGIISIYNKSDNEKIEINMYM